MELRYAWGCQSFYIPGGSGALLSVLASLKSVSSQCLWWNCATTSSGKFSSPKAFIVSGGSLCQVGHWVWNQTRRPICCGDSLGSKQAAESLLTWLTAILLHFCSYLMLLAIVWLLLIIFYVSIDVISNMKEAHCACSEVALQSMLLRTRMSNSFYVVGHMKSTFIPSGPDQWKPPVLSAYRTLITRVMTEISQCKKKKFNFNHNLSFST